MTTCREHMWNTAQFVNGRVLKRDRGCAVEGVQIVERLVWSLRAEHSAQTQI